MAIYGRKMAFGVPEIKPIVPLPQGRVRIRLRPDDFATAFVKTDKGIRRYYINDNADTWGLGICRGENKTIQ